MTAFLISLLNLVKSNRFYYYIQFVPPLETTMLEIIININVNIIIITIIISHIMVGSGNLR